MQTHYLLHADVKVWEVKVLEHNRSESFPIGPAVQGSFSHQTPVVLRGHFQLTVKRVVPHVLHVFPVVDLALAYWFIGV